MQSYFNNKLKQSSKIQEKGKIFNSTDPDCKKSDPEKNHIKSEDIPILQNSQVVKWFVYLLIV